MGDDRSIRSERKLKSRRLVNFRFSGSSRYYLDIFRTPSRYFVNMCQLSIRNSNDMQNLTRLSFVIFLMSTTEAYAYVDPGSGSVIVTTVLGLIAAIGYTFRKYFYKLKRMISGGGSNDEPKKDT